MSELKILGLINARGGSKRLPRKNIALLDGKPLISYAIKAAKESKLINRVVVSTDDQEIADIAKKYGAEVPFMRPKDLAGDDVTQLPPTKHAILELKKLGWSPDIIVLLYAVTPFKTGGDIDKAIKMLLETKADSVRAVCKTFVHPFRLCKLDNENNLSPFLDIDWENNDIAISQKYPDIYQLTGLLEVLRACTILETNTLFGKKIKACIFEQEKCIDIDTHFDFEVAEMLAGRPKKI